MGGIGRRQVGHPQAARRRHVARRQALHLRRRRLLRAQGVEGIAEPRPRGVQAADGGRHAGRAYRDPSVRDPDPLSAHSQRVACADVGGAETHLRRHRHRQEPREYRPHRNRTLQVRGAQAGRILSSEAQRILLGQGAALSRRDRLSGAARPRRGRQRARGGPDRSRRILCRAAGRSRSDRKGARPQGLCQRL